ncbi:MoaD/ThiS family protein [Mycolicibacterium thermoresistibile]|jgi:molybdopterin converting factor small subunit|uniref:MoaD/ThiS family protein n=1 Tax=Mycolicibacterium thermoresistibile TaxID=1797 RepID=UPI00031D2A39|nr:MoaD/ThiS family protein [Mycolicibacterium thermoresistibile]MCV7189008.1 MoaD/ThiS family protein [Mycolicibacterium thermoresistibile]
MTVATPTQPTQTRPGQPVVELTVRYFAAARAAAGVDEQTVRVPAGATVQELADQLARGSAELSRVLPRCSYLCDGVAVRDTAQPLHPGQTVDVLPPFAGG